MSKSNKIYEYELELEVEKIVDEKSIKEKVKKKYFIQKPNIYLREESELFYGKKLAQAIKRGFLTEPQMEKRYLNDDGAFSEKDKDKYMDLIKDFASKNEEYQKINIQKRKNKEEKAREEELLSELTIIMKEIQKFDVARNDLYKNTAEHFAKTKTAFWWALFLSYIIDEEGKERPFFEGETYEEKMESYSQYEENNDVFSSKEYRYFLYYISAWYYHNVNTKEQFEKLNKFIEDEDLII